MAGQDGLVQVGSEIGLKDSLAQDNTCVEEIPYPRVGKSGNAVHLVFFYYYNRTTKCSQWERPGQLAAQQFREIMERLTRIHEYAKLWKPHGCTCAKNGLEYAKLPKLHGCEYAGTKGRSAKHGPEFYKWDQYTTWRNNRVWGECNGCSDRNGDGQGRGASNPE